MLAAWGRKRVYRNMKLCATNVLQAAHSQVASMASGVIRVGIIGPKCAFLYSVYPCALLPHCLALWLRGWRQHKEASHTASAEDRRGFCRFCCQQVFGIIKESSC